jgi:hypothetical protein
MVIREIQIDWNCIQIKWKWIEIPLKENRFPNSFIGLMASVMRMAQKEAQEILTAEDN